jgi:hypothetical protein
MNEGSLVCQDERSKHTVMLSEAKHLDEIALIYGEMLHGACPEASKGSA